MEGRGECAEMTKKDELVNDLTTGSIPKVLLTFAWPVMLSNLLQIVYTMVDMIVVGRAVGSAGLTAVSNGGELSVLATTICIGFSSAGQVLISQFIGSGDLGAVKRTIGTMFSFMTMVSLLVTLIGIPLIKPVLGIMNVPEESFASAFDYVLVCYGGMFFIFGYNMISAILRGMGDSRHPLAFIAIAAVVNLALDLLFVAGFGWGVRGAAFATVIGQAVSYISSLIYLYRRREAFGFDFKRASFAISRRILLQIIRLGLPLGLQYGAVALSKLFVQSYINSYGVVAAAVTGIGLKIGQCASIVTQGLGSAGTSIVGQNFGAGKFDRITKTVYTAWGYGLVFAAILSVLLTIFPTQIFGLFDKNPAVLAMAGSFVSAAILRFFGYALRSPMIGFINGMGNPLLSLTVGLLDSVIGRVLLSILLGKTLNLGIQGFWYGDALAGFFPFIIGGAWFFPGKWKKHRALT